jgi:hypothetical protein
MEDFLITEINGVGRELSETFWSLWLNFEPTKVGGCQTLIKNGDSVLWALIRDRQGGMRDVSISEQLAHSGV